MKLNDGTDFFSLSVASDERMRAVHMFPEVGYMDITSNTNREGCDLHLLVVKDDSGETYIGCASVLPCQQRWVFKNIYAFLRIMFGDTTMSRMKLMFIDHDPAEHDPLNACIQIEDCFKLALHMLCIFHGLAMKCQERIYKLLLQKRSNTKELSPKGNLYDESLSRVRFPFLGG